MNSITFFKYILGDDFMDFAEICKNSIVIDAHSDIPLDLLQNKTRNNKEVLISKHLPLLKKGEVNIIFANLFTNLHPESSLKEAMLEISYLYNELDNTDELIIIRSKEDLEKVIENKKIGIVLSMEGFEPVGNSVELLRSFYEAGLRSAMLTWNYRNYFASGVGEIGGLSKLGKETIREMERMGIIVDVSHLNEEGFWDVIDVCSKPIIASHSNAKKVYNHQRNLTDEQIKAIVDTGGVIGVNGYFTEERGKDSMDTYMNQLEYLIDKAGENHVGFGFDFNGYLEGGVKVQGLEDCTCIPKITRELVKRGYKKSTIQKILGENFLRILKGIL